MLSGQETVTGKAFFPRSVRPSVSWGQSRPSGQRRLAPRAAAVDQAANSTRADIMGSGISGWRRLAPDIPEPLVLAGPVQVFESLLLTNFSREITIEICLSRMSRPGR